MLSGIDCVNGTLVSHHSLTHGVSVSNGHHGVNITTNAIHGVNINNDNHHVNITNSKHVVTSLTGSWDWTSIRRTLLTENNKPGHKRQDLMVAPHTSKLVIFDRTKVN